MSLQPSFLVMTLLLGAASLAAPPASWAQTAAPVAARRVPPADTSPVWREIEAAVGLAGGLEVKASAAVLAEGQALTLAVRLPRAGYLNIISIDASGEATVLFPNQFHADNRVEPGAFRLPTERMNFSLAARPPYGKSLLAAFLTSEPLDLYANGNGQRDVAGRMREQFAQLSSAGTQALSQLGTKSFVVEARKPAPMLAGMTVAEVCPTSQPCSAAATRPDAGTNAAANSAPELPDSYVPGILLEPEDMFGATKAAFLRPIFDKGLKLTKVSEGFVPRLYNDAAGYCTIAYGHLIKKERCVGTEPPDFLDGVTEPEGADLLKRDMARAQRAVAALVIKVEELTDGQYAALCDFTYNAGAGNLKKSELLKAVNAREHHRVPAQLRRWTKAGPKVLPGLVRRRELESTLYMEGLPAAKDVLLGEDTTPLDILSGR